MASSSNVNLKDRNEIEDRNPSPPAEMLQHEQDLAPDRVGESVFSKQWLIQVLINIVESVNEEISSGQISEEVQEGEQAVSSDIREIDPKLEDNVCALWDMSANNDVAHFLQEFKVVDILIEAIEKTKCPRLVEVAVGVLGNLASFDDLCQDISRNESLIEVIISLSGSSDAPTIVQVLRLIRTSVVNDEACQPWLEAFQADPSFMRNIKFIFENSLNGEVLKRALQLLYYILDKNNLCRKWAEEDYMKSLSTVAVQLASHKDSIALDELWLLLNLLCQNEESVVAISKHFDVFRCVFFSYISLFGEYDHTVLPCPERTAPVAAGYTTLATIAKCNEDFYERLKDDTFLQTVERMYKATQGVLTKCTILGEVFDEDESPEGGENSAHDSSYSQTSEYNGKINASYSKNEFRLSLKITKDDYNALFILKETIAEFCRPIIPSLIQDEDG